MKSLLTFLILIFFPIFSMADAANALSTALKHYQTLSGNFTQTMVDEQGVSIQESSGAFIVKKPGYFHWDTKEPFPQLLVSDLEHIWLYDPDLEQVTIRSYQKSTNHSPALLLSGDAEQITQHYSVNKTSPDKKHKNIITEQFILTPLVQQDSAFTTLQLSFNQKTLVQMVMKDSLQQITTFNFSDVVLNQSFSDSMFTFTPPEGVDVLADE